MLCSQGTCAQTTTDPKTKKLKTDKAKFLALYRKQTDGSWKVVVDAMIPDPGMWFLGTVKDRE
jgi:ketosteroid isomerase-like protein